MQIFIFVVIFGIFSFTILQICFRFLQIFNFRSFQIFQISTRFVVVADWRLHATGPFDLLLLDGRHSFEARWEWHAPPSKVYLLEVPFEVRPLITWTSGIDHSVLLDD